MAMSFSSSCLRCCCRSAFTRLLFYRHSSQQLFRIVLAFVFFFTLLTSIAICAFFDLSFFFCSGSYLAAGVEISPLKRGSICESSSIASLAMLMVSFSSGSCRSGSSAESIIIFSVKYVVMLSLRSEQNSTNLRQSSISFVKFPFVACFLQAYSCPSTEQMNSFESVFDFYPRPLDDAITYYLSTKSPPSAILHQTPPFHSFQSENISLHSTQFLIFALFGIYDRFQLIFIIEKTLRPYFELLNNRLTVRTNLLSKLELRAHSSSLTTPRSSILLRTYSETNM